MATASTAIASVATFRRPNPVRICFKEAKYEFLKNLRNPMYSVSTVLFPLMFYVLFGLVMGKQMIGPELRMPGVFDAEQPCPADAPVAQRLLAFSGRKV